MAQLRYPDRRDAEDGKITEADVEYYWPGWATRKADYPPPPLTKPSMVFPPFRVTIRGLARPSSKEEVRARYDRWYAQRLSDLPFGSKVLAIATFRFNNFYVIEALFANGVAAGSQATLFPLEAVEELQMARETWRALARHFWALSKEQQIQRWRNSDQVYYYSDRRPPPGPPRQ